MTRPQEPESASTPADDTRDEADGRDAAADARDAAADARDDADGPSMTSRFLGGLSLGALVGAAIAGSAIWDRSRRREDGPPNGPADRADDPD